MMYTCIAPCLFGMEATVAYELKNLGCKVISKSDGRVRFETDAAGIVRANLWLRTAERVLVLVGECKARSFEALYNALRKMPFEKYIPKQAAFPVAKAKTVDSQLHSVPDIQAIAKKAVADRLMEAHKVKNLPEIGGVHPILLFLFKDQAEVTIDTTGPALHKRGYRERTVTAPLRETIAAYMVLASPWKPGRMLVDPMCGSGTLLIEAALIGANIAPGLQRRFAGEEIGFLPPALWKEGRQKAVQDIRSEPFQIQGYDTDPQALEQARENARLADVEDYIRFEKGDVADFCPQETHGVLITNPPYGERIGPQGTMEDFYKVLRKTLRGLNGWSIYLITTEENLDRIVGIPFQKKRKLYHGTLKAWFWQYLGPRPAQNQESAALKI